MSCLSLFPLSLCSFLYLFLLLFNFLFLFLFNFLFFFIFLSLSLSPSHTLSLSHSLSLCLSLSLSLSLFFLFLSHTRHRQKHRPWGREGLLAFSLSVFSAFFLAEEKDKNIGEKETLHLLLTMLLTLLSSLPPSRVSFSIPFFFLVFCCLSFCSSAGFRAGDFPQPRSLSFCLSVSLSLCPLSLCFFVSLFLFSIVCLEELEEEQEGEQEELPRNRFAEEKRE